MPKSEVARILLDIEQEYQASKHGLEGLSCGSARHDFITRKTENIGRHHEDLIKLVDPEKAITLIAETIWTSTERTVSS